jgi:hypothetical protein
MTLRPFLPLLHWWAYVLFEVTATNVAGETIEVGGKGRTVTGDDQNTFRIATTLSLMTGERFFVHAYDEQYAGAQIGACRSEH